jgi:maleamate amidohydrolase
MTKRPWDPYLSERDRAVLAASGYGQLGGFGKRPVVLVVDVNYAFAGDRPEPILESIKRWPNSCGLEAWAAIEKIAGLLDVARAKGLPVIYTTSIRRPDGWDFGGWLWKSSRTLSEKPPSTNARKGSDIPDEIAPQPTDIVIRKRKPSAFHNTDLASYLVTLGADSLLVVGTTTSGCVRASVVDAFSHHYRVILAEDGCFDRTDVSHAINLFDMQAKYADVTTCAAIKDYVAALPDGLFQLPSGRFMTRQDHGA